MEYEIIQEGPIKLKIPKIAKYFTGPGTKVPGFYNPVMAFSRDISTVFLLYAAEKGKIKTVLDALAGSGARGLRYKAAIPEVEVHLNDVSSEAVRLIIENARLNDLDVIVHNMDFHILASLRRFSYIDIDPFGSPVHFSEPSIRSLENIGYLAVTATDTAALFGSYPATVQRRYGAVNFRHDFCKEAGVRILIGFFMREAGKWDKWIWPIHAYVSHHHIRIFLEVRKGARNADQVIKKYIGYVNFNNEELKFSQRPSETFAGPLWIGPIFDEGFLRFFQRVANNVELACTSEIKKYLSLWLEESQINAPYYNIHRLLAKYKITKIPKMATLIGTLKEMGYNASRTHFDPISIKTNAPIRDIIYAAKD